jgi:hypothetical protein
MSDDESPPDVLRDCLSRHASAYKEMCNKIKNHDTKLLHVSKCTTTLQQELKKYKAQVCKLLRQNTGPPLAAQAEPMQIFTVEQLSFLHNLIRQQLSERFSNASEETLPVVYGRQKKAVEPSTPQDTSITRSYHALQQAEEIYQKTFL